MNEIEKRKNDHIRINLEKDVSAGITTGFDRYAFVHSALPEFDLEQVDTKTEFIGLKLELPVLISSMTGGTEEGDRINIRLAEAAQRTGIAMGVGSQRAVFEGGRPNYDLGLRQYATSVPLFANLGAIQLNYGYSVDECRRAVELIQANALILHLNPLQEALQTGGQTKYGGLTKKIEEICTRLDVPVIVKEVGWGISAAIARKLVDVGVAAIDVAGAGGTSWSEVEKHRTNDEKLFRISSQFRKWGIPTADALRQVHFELPEIPLIASGGLKNGIDLAKSIALGASLGGFAGILLKAASVSTECVIDSLNEISQVLRLAMFASGHKTISELSNSKLTHANDES